MAGKRITDLGLIALGDITSGDFMLIHDTETNEAKRIDAADFAAFAGATYNMSTMTDVTLTVPSLGQMLEYDGAQWVNVNQTHVEADIVDLQPYLLAADLAPYETAATTALRTWTEADITDLQSYALSADMTSSLAAKADLVGGEVPTSQIPAIAMSEYLGSVANETALLSLSGDAGDWAIRSDLSVTYVLTQSGGSSLGHWQALATPADAVLSVNGSNGVVVLSASDVGAYTTAEVDAKTWVESDITDLKPYLLAADLVPYETAATTAARTWTESDITDLKPYLLAADLNPYETAATTAARTWTESDITDLKSYLLAADLNPYETSATTAARTWVEADITDLQDYALDSKVDEIDANADSLISLSGVAENSSHMGSFSGSTISDDKNVKEALQELEVAMELRETAATTAARTWTESDITDLQDYALDSDLTIQSIAAAVASIKIANLNALSGVSVNESDMGSFSGSVIDNDSTVKEALQDLETELELKASTASVDAHTWTESDITDLGDYATNSKVDEIDANADSLIALSGVAENAANLGTFSGSTIADSSAVKAALQALETALELRETAATTAARTWTESDITDLQAYLVAADLNDYETAATTAARTWTESDITDLKSYLLASDLSPYETAAQTAARTWTESDITDLQTYAVASDVTTSLASKADLVGGVVPNSQIPAIAMSTYLGSAANQAARLAFSGQSGDWCVQADESKTYVLTTTGGSSTSHWQVLSTPVDAVASVNGATGTVVLAASDVGAYTTAQVDAKTWTESDITDLKSYLLAADIADFETSATIAARTWTESDITDLGDYATNAKVDEIDVNVNNAITVSGVAENATHLGTFSGATVADSSSVKSALQALETALELRETAATTAARTWTESDITDLQDYALDSKVDEIDANADALVSLSGVAENATHLGTFSGSTVANSSSVKAALQAIETALELRETAAQTAARTWTESDITDLQAYLVASDLNDYETAATTAARTWVEADIADLKDYLVAADLNAYETAATTAARTWTESDITDLQDYLVASDLSAYETAATTAARTWTESDITDLQAYALDSKVDEIDANANSLISLSGVAENASNLGSFTGSTIASSSTVKVAMQALETKVETMALDSKVDEIDANADSLIVLSGVAENAEHLGTFSGSTIVDDSVVKVALQALETKVETMATDAKVDEIDANADNLVTLSGVAENAVNLGAFSGSTISDNQTIKVALQSLETKVETMSLDSKVDEIDANADSLIALTGRSEQAEHMGTFTGSTITDNSTLKVVAQELETKVELMISLADLKTEVAAASDFSDFQSRIAAL